MQERIRISVWIAAAVGVLLVGALFLGIGVITTRQERGPAPVEIVPSGDETIGGTLAEAAGSKPMDGLSGEIRAGQNAAAPLDKGSAPLTREVQPNRPKGNGLIGQGAGAMILPLPRIVDAGQEAELASLEEEASRHAAGLGMDSSAVEEALRGLQPNRGESPDEFAHRVEDERRRLLANAYLVEATTRENLEAVVFPAGFPAEQRAREAAQATVNAYESNADAKITYLRRALDNYRSLSTPLQVQYEAVRPLPLRLDSTE